MHKIFNALKGKGVALAAAGTAALASAPAFASGGSGGVDVGNVVSAIQGAAAPIAAIGGAVLTVLVGIKVYKWVRRAM
nr:major capsid protein [Stenotrophomonas pavanii]